MCRFENDRISAICPHCYYENRIAIKYLLQDINVIYCNLDEGGCDRLFGVKVQVQSTVELYTMEKVQQTDKNWREVTLQAALFTKKDECNNE